MTGKTERATKTRIFGESTLVASSELPLTPARHTRKGSGEDGGSLGIFGARGSRRKYEGFDSNRGDAANRARTRFGVRALFVVDLRGIEPLSENRRYDFLRGQSLY